MLRSALFAFGLCLAAPVFPAAAQQAPVFAQAPAPVAALLDAMGMDDMLPILRTEGLAYALDLEEQMFPGRGGAAWQAMADKIYSAERMERIMAEQFAVQVGDAELVELTEFFLSDQGRLIVKLEIAAREAMLDEAVDGASREVLSRMRGRDDPRLALLTEFVEINDLIETNIVGAMNANFAFYKGLVAGGALSFEMSEEDMLRDVWAQEPEIREETEDWVYSYLALAYQPLEDADIKAYIALSKTEEGRAMNAALFAAFDALFVEISKDLGLASAQFMAGEDI